MTLSSYNHELRLERAGEHIEEVNAELECWYEDPIDFVLGTDRSRGEYAVWVGRLRTPTPQLGLIIGDCLHNLRAALDNLVYDLSVANSGSPLSPDVEKNSEFPIFGCESQYEKQRKRKIGAIAPGAQEIIGCLQPYKRGDNYTSHPFWILHELSNIDKHRLIHLPVVTGEHIEIHAPSPSITITDFKTGSLLEVGTMLARFSTEAFEPEQQMKAKVDLKLSATFPPESVARGLRVVGTLRQIREYIIDEVLPPFLPYLQEIKLQNHPYRT